MNRYFCYRNLHKEGVVYSLKNIKTNLVEKWLDFVFLTNVEFKVSFSGRQRVLIEKRKNVHAGVIGTLIEPSEISGISFVKCRYNPYEMEWFMANGRRVTKCRYAILNANGLWISDDFA